jgi:hypothetical protein
MWLPRIADDSDAELFRRRRLSRADVDQLHILPLIPRREVAPADYVAIK